MKPAGPSNEAKPASLPKGEVPEPKAVPDAVREGANSLKNGANGY